MYYHLTAEKVLLLSENILVRALHIIVLQTTLLLSLWL